MTTLLHPAAPTQADDLDALTDTTDHSEPFVPSVLDEAEHIGYGHGLADAYPSPDRRWPDAARMRYALGRQRGARVRQEREAYEMGYALGLETELSEPPAGFRDGEKAAYRDGFRAAQREYEEWLEAIDRQRRLEESFAEYDAWADAHPDEVVEAAGVMALRKA